MFSFFILFAISKPRHSAAIRRGWERRRAGSPALGTFCEPFPSRLLELGIIKFLVKSAFRH